MFFVYDTANIFGISSVSMVSTINGFSSNRCVSSFGKHFLSQKPISVMYATVAKGRVFHAVKFWL